MIFPAADAAMKGWSPEQWAIFFSAAGVFVGVVCTAITALFVKVFGAISENRRETDKLRSATTSNSKALVPLIEENNLDPTTRDVDPTVAAEVKKSAESIPAEK